MHLAPHELDRIKLSALAQLAQARRGRGVLLNYPESVAILADAARETARDGGTHQQVVDAVRHALDSSQVMPGVRSLLSQFQIEVLFGDGNRLVTVAQPLGEADNDELQPGELILAEDDIVLNAGLQTTTVRITNTGSRPIWVGSHYPLGLVNRALEFDRTGLERFRLDVAAGALKYFPPGEPIDVQALPLEEN